MRRFESSTDRTTITEEGKDWHRTWEDASIRASIMVQKKIDSHSKAIAKLMKMTFTNPEAAP